MSKIKSLRIQKTIKIWNLLNDDKPKKTALTISAKIGIHNRSLTVWDKINVPKQIQCLNRISEILDVRFDDLFEYEFNPETRKTELKRIILKEFMDVKGYTFDSLSKEIPYYKPRLRMWNKGELPSSIINFTNFCMEVETEPHLVLEY